MSDLPLVAKPYALQPETFGWLIVRRVRYLIGICVAIALWTIVWPLMAPSADYTGVSLMVWSHSTELLSVIMLLAVMLVSTLLNMLLVHPDSPHMGLLCTMLGLCTVSIRGGSSRMLVAFAQKQGMFSRISTLLAIECVQWIVLFILTALLSGIIYDRFFLNMRWIHRSGAKVNVPEGAKLRTDGPPLGIAETVSKGCGLAMLPTGVATLLAVIVSSILTGVLLWMLLQSPLKGQVLFGCFVATFFGALFTYLFFPRASPLGYFVVPLIVALCGYLLGMSRAGMYPGIAGWPLSYALPIDFASAGISGAIIGYYSGFKWSLHTQE